MLALEELECEIRTKGTTSEKVERLEAVMHEHPLNIAVLQKLFPAREYARIDELDVAQWSPVQVGYWLEERMKLVGFVDANEAVLEQGNKRRTVKRATKRGVRSTGGPKAGTSAAGTETGVGRRQLLHGWMRRRR